MRDGLRAVDCPSDVIDQIGGWLYTGLRNSYGMVIPKLFLLKSMNKIASIDSHLILARKRRLQLRQ